MKKLAELGLLNGVMKRSCRNRPLNEDDKQVNRLISSTRYTKERTFGIWKQTYGLAKSHYLSSKKVEYQTDMIGLAYKIIPLI